jgi:hypothetical protein
MKRNLRSRLQHTVPVNTTMSRRRGPYRAPDLHLPAHVKNRRDGGLTTMPLIAKMTPAKESDNGVEVQLFGIDASIPPLCHRYHMCEEMVCP